MNIAVLGAGSMACAMGAHLGRQGLPDKTVVKVSGGSGKDKPV
jgi:ketopantoate reductase